MKLRGPANPITDEEKKKIFELNKGGKNYIEIATELNRSQPGIHRILFPKLKNEQSHLFDLKQYLSSTVTI